MTIKEKVCAVISRMPEKSGFDDIQCRLYVLECIERVPKHAEIPQTEHKIATLNAGSNCRKEAGASVTAYSCLTYMPAGRARRRFTQ